MMSPEHQRQNANDNSRQHGPVVQTRIDALIPRFYYFPDLFPYSHKQWFEYVAKLRKKSVTKDGFWKINANRFSETLVRARIRPKIKAKRGRLKKFNLGQIANWGGLMKELGFLFVTAFSHLLHLCDEAVETCQQFLVGTALNWYYFHIVFNFL